MKNAVEIIKINKEYWIDEDSTQVLFDVSGEIHQGELTMLVGPSGCGKTTLISIITGILSQTTGDIRLFGHSLNAMSELDKVYFRRRNIGFIFQQYNLLPALTAAENAAVPLLAAGLNYTDALERARTVLERIGMKWQTEKLPRQLSGGQQQRVAIARALVHNPKLIVCDEPTAALDAKSGHAVMEILREVANDGERAVLIVTHDSRIYRFSDRILEMSDGRITGDFNPKDYIHKE